MKKQHKHGHLIIAGLLVIMIVFGAVAVFHPFTAQANKAQAKEQAAVTQEAAASASVGGDSRLTKNETVYAKLDLNGSVKDTTVVSWLHYDGSHPSNLMDPVKLDNPRAMNGSFVVTAAADGTNIAKMDANQNDFFYDGQTNKALPETVDIKYYWQGKEIAGKDLIGKSGPVKIVVNMHNQLAGGKIGDTDIYTPLVSMVSLELPIDKFSNVEAGEGLITTVGETMKVNWMLFPYPDAAAVMTADARDFELAGISIIIQPKMPPLPEVKIGDQLKQLDDGLASMDNALAQMEAGSGKLAGGGQQLQDGLNQIADGADKLAALNQVQQKIVVGSIAIDDKIITAITPYADNTMVKPILAGLTQQKQLLVTMLKGGTLEGQQLPAMGVTADKLTEMKDGLQKLEAGSTAAVDGASKINSGLTQVRRQGIAPMREGLAKALVQVNSGDTIKATLQQRVDDYNTFLGKPAGSQSRVQFILQTEDLTK